MIFSINKRMREAIKFERENGNEFFQNKFEVESTREYFENYFETVYFAKRMGLMKHYFVFVAFGIHFICLLARLLLFDWSSIWNSNCSPSIPIQLIWVSIVPITVSVLILTQAYGGKIKTYKYYYCTTFLAYEFVWICSIFTYVYLWIKIYYDSAENNMESSSKLVILLYAMAAGYTICSHWATNTSVHFSLCRREIFAIELKRTQLFITSHGLCPAWFILLNLLIILSSTWTVISKGVDNGTIVLLCSFFYLQMIFILTSHCVTFVERESKDLLPIFVLVVLIIVMPWRETHFEFLFVTDFILCWICCLSIGRMWFLDMEIDPEKYTEHFKRDLLTLALFGTRDKYNKFCEQAIEFKKSGFLELTSPHEL